jgi:DNA-binding PadR family transcriptional regulator
MEKKSFIKCQWNMNGERPKKVYSLTGEGKSLLEYTTGSLKTICRIIGTENNPSRDENLQFNIARSSPKDREHYAV